MRNSQRVLELKNWTDGIPLTNIVTGGNFPSTAGWTGVDAVVDGIAEYTATVQYDTIEQTKSAIATSLRNHKVYFTATIKADSTSVLLIFNDGVSQTTVAHTGSNEYVKLSGIRTIDASATSAIFRVQDNRASAWTKIYVDNYMAFDLTAAFGAGLEPTAAQMDAMLTASGITYFDGTRNISLAGYTRTIDRSRSQLHGTLSGGAAYKLVNGLHVLDFTNPTSLCTIPKGSAINDMTQFSFAAWVWYGGAGGGNVGRIFDKVARRAYISPAISCIVFAHNFSVGTGAWNTQANTLTLNNYHHVAITYDNGATANDPAIYIDGVLKTLTITRPIGTASADNANDLCLGNRASTLDASLNGYLSEVTMQRGIMTAAEVKRIYNSSFYKYPGKQVAL